MPCIAIHVHRKQKKNSANDIKYHQMDRKMKKTMKILTTGIPTGTGKSEKKKKKKKKREDHSEGNYDDKLTALS